jgi:hypothetical protein
VLSRDFRQILRAACPAEQKHYESKMKYSAPSHGSNLRLLRPAGQIT